MDDNVMWAIWWVATIGICGWKILEGLFRPRRMLEWPFLASGMWAYFYGYLAYTAKTGLPEYLGNGIANIGQFMPLLCLIALLAGWYVGTQKSKPMAPDRRIYPYGRFYLAGMFFLLVGSVGAYSVMQKIKTGQMDFADSSAYWYLIFYVGYPGLAISLWALVKMEASWAKKYLWAVTVVALIIFMFPHVLDARRGPLFPSIMILLLVPPLAARRQPNPLLFFAVLAAGGLVMLLFLQVREITYNGGTWAEAIHHLDVGSAVTEKAERAEDNEYVNNCQLIGTIYQNGKYQYGTGHLSLLWHWIPRAIWKDKPVLGEGIYSFNEMFDDVESATGFRLLGTGASSAGVADTFVQYGVFCPLFWFFLSWGIGAIYYRTLVGNNARWLFCYVGFICASHWLISQGFSAAFVPFMFFQAVPFVIFAALDPDFRAWLLGGGAATAPARKMRRPARYPVPQGAGQP